MKKNIVWLASYPKSGNTWTRIFLANYLANLDQPVSVNQIHRFGMGDSMVRTYRMVNGGKDPDLSNYDDTIRLRHRVLAGISGNQADVNFVKTHNLYGKAMGIDLIPPQITRCAIYIVRNPLDVTLSFGRHFGQSPEEAVKSMADSDHVTSPGQKSVWQFLGSWSDHVSSWTTKHPFPCLVMRYEDMLSNPEETFGKALDIIGIPVEKERLKKAIRFSSFEETVKQEDKHGFKEASKKADRFFAKGKAGQWREDLSPDLINKTKRWHRKTMKKFGYLDD